MDRANNERVFISKSNSKEEAFNELLNPIIKRKASPSRIAS